MYWLAKFARWFSPLFQQSPNHTTIRFVPHHHSIKSIYLDNSVKTITIGDYEKSGSVKITSAGRFINIDYGSRSILIDMQHDYRKIVHKNPLGKAVYYDDGLVQVFSSVLTILYMADYTAVRLYSRYYLITEYDYDTALNLLPEDCTVEPITQVQFRSLQRSLSENNNNNIPVWSSCMPHDHFESISITPDHLVKWYLYAAVNNSCALLPDGVLDNYIVLVDRVIGAMGTARYLKNKLKLIRYVSRHKNYFDTESLELIMVTLVKY